MTLAVGFDIGGTNARGAVVRDGEEVVAMGRASLTERSPEAVVEVVARLRDELAAGDARQVGVGLAAMLDAGKVRNAPNLGWRNVDFGALLSARLQAKVVLANDLSAAAWGEHRQGASRGVADSFTVFVGTGVGSAMILRGEPYRGSRGLGGELGHVKVVARGGRPCGCGSSGCLEAYVGGGKLATWMAEKGLSGGAEQLELLAEAGNPVARELFDFVSVTLATAIANQVSVLNPAMVVLGGGVLARTPRLRAFLMQAIPALAVEPAREGLAVVSAELGDDSGAIGAALLAQRLT